MSLLRLLVVLSVVVAANTAAADLNRLMPDMQRSSSRNGAIDVVLWMPVEFWSAMLEQDQRVPASAREVLLATVRDVNLFAVISGQVSPFGAVKMRTHEQILGSLVLRVGERTLFPLGDDELNDGVRELLETMKPALAEALGSMGAGLEFFAYSNVDDQGAVLLDPLQPGAFEIELRGVKHHWRLPLGSLLPPRFDPDTGEEFPGNFRFSPFTGRELVER